MTRRPVTALAGALGAALLLSACVSAPVNNTVAALPPVMTAPPVAVGWQWGAPDTTTKSEGNTSAMLTTTRVLLGSSIDPHTATIALYCFDAGPSVAVIWDGPVGFTGPSALSYRFTGQQPHDVAAAPLNPNSQVVIDPAAVARFLDEASVSQELVVRVNTPSAGMAEATFDANDAAGNLKRFRSACVTGTN